MTNKSGEPRNGELPGTIARRVAAWLVWWVLLMSFWVMIDDSVQPDELLAGLGAAAIAATFAEVVTYQAATRFRMRIAWLPPAAKLPAQVIRDTWTVFAALYRKLARGQDPGSEFVTEPFEYGDDETRRFLYTGARSLAPNSFVVGLDAGTGTVTVHRLVKRS